MSALLAEPLIRAVSRLTTLCGNQTFTWNNTEVPCVPNSLTRGMVIEVGGLPVSIDLTLFVLFTAFATADNTIITVDSDLYTVDNELPTPVAGKTLIYRNVRRRIISAKLAAPLSHIEIHLADPNSGN